LTSIWWRSGAGNLGIFNGRKADAVGEAFVDGYQDTSTMETVVLEVLGAEDINVLMLEIG
jgi:hypothetical protein